MSDNSNEMNPFLRALAAAIAGAINVREEHPEYDFKTGDRVKIMEQADLVSIMCKQNEQFLFTKDEVIKGVPKALSFLDEVLIFIEKLKEPHPYKCGNCQHDHYHQMLVFSPTLGKELYVHDVSIVPV